VKEFIDIYLQAGAAGLVCVLFAFMIMKTPRELNTVKEFIDIYLQAGAAGLVCVLFAFMIMNLIRSQREQTDDLDKIKNDITKLATEMSNSQSIVIKLVDRLNVSDNSREKFNLDIIKEINDLSDVMMEVKGSVSRINGK